MILYRKIFSFATVTLLVALSLSAVAAWYSILGLTAIFAAAVIPIIIMGGALELAKVVTTVWLHRYWNRCGLGMKLYLVPAVIALALLTSMGIFGFLSKAHTDQTIQAGGNNELKIEMLERKIQRQQGIINDSEKVVAQLDETVEKLQEYDRIRGPDGAIAIRASQAEERTALNETIEASYNAIEDLQTELLPFKKQQISLEVEIGPLKYIAAMIYGDNPDTNLVERAVRWVIVLIVLVFDPLALMLMLAAQSGYRWQEEDEKKEEENKVEGKDQPKIKPVSVEKIEDYGSDARTPPDEVAKVDDAVVEPLTEEPIPDADKPAPGEAEPAEKVKIQTEGVTLHEIQEGYYDIEGKSMSKAALLGIRPELFSARPDAEQSSTNFGTEFPRFAKKADIFVRVDVLPNKVFKFDGYKWIEINKENSDSYLYDEAYIRHLVNKIASGEYDIGLLSENEKAQIEEYLQRNQSQDK